MVIRNQPRHQPEVLASEVSEPEPAEPEKDGFSLKKRIALGVAGALSAVAVVGPSAVANFAIDVTDRLINEDETRRGWEDDHHRPWPHLLAAKNIAGWTTWAFAFRVETIPS